MYLLKKLIILFAIATNTVLATIALGSLELQKNKPLLNSTLYPPSQARRTNTR
jgi:hypothetical protein